MRVLLLAAVVVAGVFGYMHYSGGGKLPFGETASAAGTSKTSANRSLIKSLKRQIADEEDALKRSIENYYKGADVHRGSHTRSYENNKRRQKIAELKARLAQLEEP